MSRSRRARRPVPTRRLVPSRRPVPDRPREPELRVRLRNPADLFAAVPHLLGFHPVDSVVLVALLGDPGSGTGRRRLGPVLRADLPTPGGAAALASVCAQRIAGTHPTEVAVLVVGGGDPGPDGWPPRDDVVTQVALALSLAQVDVTMSAWVARIASKEPWRCYAPCECPGGVLPTLDTTEVAAASAMLGRVTYGTRTELEASLAPTPEAESPRRRELVAKAWESALVDRELAGEAAACRDVEAVRQARVEVGAGRILGDVELVRVGVALSDVRVRDACLGWALDDDPADVEQLWTVLVRELPAPEVAEPAALLALTLLARGGGALVGVALGRALCAHPEHRLSRLTESMLASGLGHAEFVEIVRESGREAARQLGL